MNKQICILLVCLSISLSNTRVAFSRPGSIIRTPGTAHSSYANQYVVGFGGEITHLNEFNYAFSNYFKGVTGGGYHYGLSYTVPHEYLEEGVASSPSSTISFHLHKQIFKRNNVGINLGLHDLLYTTDGPHRVSLFTSFNYLKNFNNNYKLESTLGFGTGSLSYDSHNYNQSTTDTTAANFFIGFRLHTPLMQDRGGINFLAEYDGSGLNLGASVPLSDAWTINLSITNFGEISKFGEWNENNTIIDDSPSLGLGFQMNIPKLKYKKVKSSVNDLSSIYNQMPYDESLDSLVRHATVLIEALEDSLAQTVQLFNSQQSLNNALKQEINYLEDSLSMVLLDDKIVEINLNKAMKHLSKSLSFYYTQNYRDALEETDKAISIFPNLAIAYARKGSIYYRLGDQDRATVNWNIALKLDPEYEEVREILISLKENNNLNSDTLPE